MTVRRVMGTETEYAVSAPAVSHANPVQLSFAEAAKRLKKETGLSIFGGK